MPQRAAPPQLIPAARSRASCACTDYPPGGPLFDLDGRIIGIHSQVTASTKANFDVPIDKYRRHWERLLKSDDWSEEEPTDEPQPDRSEPPTAATGLGVRLDQTPDGVRVAEVHPGGPASRAGLAAGDVLLVLHGSRVLRAGSVDRVLKAAEAGDCIELRFRRGAQELQTQVVLGGLATATSGADDDATPLRVRLRGIGAALQGSVVQITSVRDDRTRRILGTIVDRSGLLLSKASELGASPQAILADGTPVAARLLATDPETDLALLGLAQEGLPAVAFSPSTAQHTGRWLISAGPDDVPLGVGVQSLEPFAVPPAGGGSLGADLEDAPELEVGVRITRVDEDGGAARSALAAGDVILAIGDFEALDQDAVASRIARET
ncbi:MAG: PDZ domain-containing protein, partial [Chloroflexi bacterium]|nr:PDZ domain-containing protein [Chloroflexota bacterium]